MKLAFTRRASIHASRDVILVSVSAAVAKGSVLLFLAALAAGLAHHIYIPLLYLTGVALAVQNMLDPTSLTLYFLQTKAQYNARSCWYQGVVLSAIVAVLIVLATMVIAVVVDTHHSLVLVTAGCFAFLSGAESFARHVRWVWQASGRFVPYAAVDWGVSAGRISVAAVGYLSANLVLVALSAVAAALMLVAWSYHGTRRASADLWQGGEGATAGVVLRGVTPYAIAGVTSSAYSQLPAVMLGLRASVREGAIFTGATRFTQPTEVIAWSIAAVAMPRLAGWPSGARRVARAQILSAVGLALVTGPVLLAVGPIGSKLLGVDWPSVRPILYILVADLPIRYLNYQLATVLIAQGLVKDRMTTTVLVATLSSVALWVAAAHGGVATALVAVAADVMLALLFASSALRKRNHSTGLSAKAAHLNAGP